MRPLLYLLTALLSLLASRATAQLWVGSDATFFAGNGATVAVGGDLINAGTLTNQGHLYLRGSLTNTGTLASAAGDLTLDGTAAQTLTSSSALVVRNLTLNSTAAGDAVTLATPLTVGGVGTFTDGVLKTDATNLLIFADGATVAGASAASHAKGSVRKVGDEAFVFPLGNGTAYRPASVAPQSGTATDAYTAEYKESDGSNTANRDACLVSVSTAEHWQVDRTAGSASAVVGLAYLNVATPNANSPEVRVARYTGSLWEPLTCAANGGTADGLVNSNGAATGFGRFTLAFKGLEQPAQTIAVTYPTLGTVCAGQTLGLTVTPSGTFNGGNAFTAQLSDASGGWGSPTGLGTVVAGSNDVTIPAGTAAGAGYKLRVVSSDPVVTSNESSAFAVNAAPTVNDPADQTVCADGQTTAVNFTGTGTSYDWTNDTPAIGLGASGSGNIAAFAAQNAGTTPLVATITVTPKASGCANGSAQTFTITVNPAPTVNDPADQAVCAGAQTTAVNFAGTATTYDWTNDTPSIGLAAAGSGNIAAFAAQNAGTTPLVATITVTPKTGSCSGAPQAFTITVNPAPTVSDPADQAVCADGQTTAVNFTGTGTSYDWTNNTPAIGLASAGSGNITAFAAQNNTSGPLVATITVTPKTGSCSGAPQTFTITVNRRPQVTSATASPNPVCPDGTLTLTAAVSGGTGTLSYDWSGPNGYDPAPTTTNPLTRPNATAQFAGTYSVTVTDGNGCQATGQTAAVTLGTASTPPQPTATAAVCAGQPLVITVPTGGGCAGTSGSLTAQLSNAKGEFDSPTATWPVAEGSNSVPLPAGLPSGSEYRVRLVGGGGQVSPLSNAITVTALVATAPAVPARACPGQAVSVSFGTQGGCSFPAGNVFTVQLSSATGSFNNPTTLGTVTPGQANSVVIPASVAAGTGYRMRVVSSNPVATSPASVPFRVDGPSLSVTPTVGGAPVCRGSAVTVSFNLPGGSCPFPGGNQFTVQLSSATGSFNNPTNLGTVLPGQSNSLTIPAGTAAGSGYRLRIVSSNPALTSSNSALFQVKACASRLSAEEAHLVVAPNPVNGQDIRCHVTGMDNPGFELTTAAGGSLPLAVKTDGSGTFVLTPRQRLATGVYLLQARQGQTRLTARVLVVE